MDVDHGVVAPGPGDGVVELRPSGRDYRRVVWSRLPFIGPFILLSLIRAAGKGDSLVQRLLLPIGITLLVAVLIALSIVHIRTSVVRLSPGRIDHHALLVPDRSLSTGDVQGVLATMSQPMTVPALMLVLRSPEAGVTLRLNGGVWTFEALETIAHHAGVDVSDQVLSGMEIERLVPHSMPLRDRRPYTFGIGVALAIVAVLTAGVVGWFAYRDLPPFDDRPPEAATPATIEQQDDLLASITSTLPGDWTTEPARLHECENDDDVKGWQRWIDAVRTGGASVDPRQIDALADVLVAAGFDEPDVRTDDSSTSISTTTATDSFGDSVTSIDVHAFDERVDEGDPGGVSVEIHGPCEVAADFDSAS